MVIACLIKFNEFFLYNNFRIPQTLLIRELVGDGEKVHGHHGRQQLHD
jgi:hypothetical protein